MGANSGRETDLLKLYSSKILSLASSIPHVGRLEAPDASVRRRAPLCGSTITVDVIVKDGVITEFAQDVKACALGQASAAVFGAQVIGRNCHEIRTARDQMKAMLADHGPVPDAPFSEFEVLIPAREFGNRHASILLAVEATLDALCQLEHANCA